MQKDGSRKISKAVISRLPAYYRNLHELLEKDITRISSEQLSRIMKTTASQVRQDLNHFGGFGQQGYGYNVTRLYEEIGKILGVEESHKVIIVGAGNITHALVNYAGFHDHGFDFICIFDRNPLTHGLAIGPVPVRPLNELPAFVRSNKVDIVTICVPREPAKIYAKKIYKLGLRSFWNFAHTDLSLPDDAFVKDVHLLDSVLELSYMINEKNIPVDK